MITRKISAEQLQKLADVLKTVAHPLRLQIIEMLEETKAMTVGEIRRRLEIEQSLASHHLIKMKDKGVLTSYRSGKCNYYALNEPKIMMIFECFSNCAMNNAQTED